MVNLTKHRRVRKRVQPYTTRTCRKTYKRTFSSVGDCALIATVLDEAGILWIVLVSCELRTDELLITEGALARALIIAVEVMLAYHKRL